MMNIMKKKLNKKGFTLAELLVVVAIIAILVAVSIPIFTSKLEESRQATDRANERAAKAAAVTAYLSDDDTLKVGEGQNADVTVNYNAETGKLDAEAPDSGYGKSGTAVTALDAPPAGVTGTPEDGYLAVTIETDGDILMAWTK